MAITVDVGAKQANIFTKSIGRWDDDPMNPAVPQERERIADNVRRALEWQGLTVSFM
jgi:hypothetical protein